MNEAEFWVELDTLEKNLPTLSARVRNICRVRNWDIRRVGVWVKNKEVRLLYEFQDGYQTWSDDVNERLIAHMMLVHLIENFDEIYFDGRGGRGYALEHIEEKIREAIAETRRRGDDDLFDKGYIQGLYRALEIIKGERDANG